MINAGKAVGDVGLYEPHGSRPAVADLRAVVPGAADEDDGPVPMLDQMRDGHLAADHVVHRDGAGPCSVLVVDNGVHDDVGDLVTAQQVEVAAGRVRGRDQHSAYPLLDEHREVFGLFLRRAGAVADHDSEPGRARRALGPARHVDEEGVAHVEHQQPDDTAGPDPQLTR